MIFGNWYYLITLDEEIMQKAKTIIKIKGVDEVLIDQ